MEKLLGFKRDAARYRTVTSAWRKSCLNDDGKEIGAVAGVGFRCLNAAERISGSVKGFQQGTRKQMRSVRRSALVRTDDSNLQRKQDLLRRFGTAIAQEANTMMKEIEPPAAAKQLPRLVPRASGQN